MTTKACAVGASAASMATQSLCSWATQLCLSGSWEPIPSFLAVPCPLGFRSGLGGLMKTYPNFHQIHSTLREFLSPRFPPALYCRGRPSDTVIVRKPRKTAYLLGKKGHYLTTDQKVVSSTLTGCTTSSTGYVNRCSCYSSHSIKNSIACLHVSGCFRPFLLGGFCGCCCLVGDPGDQEPVAERFPCLN